MWWHAASTAAGEEAQRPASPATGAAAAGIGTGTTLQEADRGALANDLVSLQVSVFVGPYAHIPMAVSYTVSHRCSAVSRFIFIFF